MYFRILRSNKFSYQNKLSQYNSVNVKLLSEVTIKLSSNLICDSNEATNLPHELLLTDRRSSNLRKDFAHNLSANMKL